MGFKFREKHQFNIDEVGSFEFDVGNVDMIEAIQREYPKLMQSVADGQKATDRYVDFFASLGIKSPHSKTTGDLMDALLKSDKINEEAAKEAETLAKDMAGCRDAAINACVSFIQGCLGIEEYAQIFSGQKGRDMQDHVNLCNALYLDSMEQRDVVVLDEVKKNQALKKGINHASKKKSR